MECQLLRTRSRLSFVFVQLFGDLLLASEGQITELARPHLENLGSTVLGVVPPSGFPAEQKSATTKRAPATLGCHPPMDKKTRFRVDL
jgi:hypothetical protein